MKNTTDMTVATYATELKDRGTLDFDAECREANVSGFYGTIKDAMATVRDDRKEDQEAMIKTGDSLESLAGDILLSYNSFEAENTPESYLALFRSLATTAANLPADYRHVFVTYVRDLIAEDAHLPEGLGSEYQIVPTLAKMVSEAEDIQDIKDAVNTARKNVQKISQLPAVDLLGYKPRINGHGYNIPTTDDVSRLLKLSDSPEQAAQQFVSEFKVKGVLPKPKGGTKQVDITLHLGDGNGGGTRRKLSWPSGISRNQTAFWSYVSSYLGVEGSIAKRRFQAMLDR